MTTWSEITLGGKPCEVADYRNWPLARQANSFFLPLGHEPGVAHVVIRQRFIDELADQINATSSAAYLPLVFRAGPPEVSLTFSKMYLGSAKRLVPGPDDSPDAAMLVTLYDKRILAKRFSPPVELTTLLTSDTSFEDDTWSEVAEKLWNAITPIGSYPGLPYTPTSQPASLRWLGLTCWEALSILLDQIGCAVSYNPLTDAFSIVKLGAAQSIPYPAADETFRTRTLLGRSTQVPEKVRVKFPGGVTTLNTSVTGAITGAYKSFVEYRSPANGTDQTNRATEIRDQWLADVQLVSEKYVYRKLYKDVMPGGTVKAVLWRNFGASDDTDSRCQGGFRTELLVHPGLTTPVEDKSHEMPQLWGTLNAALAQGSSAKMSIFWREAGSWTDSATDIAVYDILLKSGASDIDSGNWVVATFEGDHYWAHAAECN